MVWLVLIALIVFLSCFAAIAVTAWQTFRRVKSLGRAVAAASERIADAAAPLEELDPNVR